MEVALALLADAANATANNKLNILGAFAHIQLPRLPFRQPSLTLIIRFEADPLEANTDKEIQVLLVDPEGREVHRLDIQGHVPSTGSPGAPIEMLFQVSMNGVSFNRVGDYSFLIREGGEVKKRIPLKVGRATDRKPHQPSMPVVIVQDCSPIKALTAEEYPILAAIWDNEDDAVYDSM